METIELRDARDRLAELIDRVQTGERFAITRAGEVVAFLDVPPSGQARGAAADAVQRVRLVRQGARLGALSSRALMAQGRR